MYDFAHPIQDALEGITHSLCSLEFEAHRPLYNWVIEHCELPCPSPADRVCPPGHRPHSHVQARSSAQLVEENRVSGWDDPRMPTLVRPAPPGLHRRRPSAISASASAWPSPPTSIEYGFLEHCLREDLNANAERTMAVLHPVKLTVTNYPEGQSETFRCGK